MPRCSKPIVSTDFCLGATQHFIIPRTELDRSQLERKVRLLAFASLAFDHIGRDLPYSQIATTLQIDTSEVEKWSIDGEHILTATHLASHVW